MIKKVIDANQIDKEKTGKEEALEKMEKFKKLFLRCKWGCLWRNTTPCGAKGHCLFRCAEIYLVKVCVVNGEKPVMLLLA